MFDLLKRAIIPVTAALLAIIALMAGWTWLGLFLLLIVYFLSVFAMVAVPGMDDSGQPVRLSYLDAAYFVTIISAIIVVILLGTTTYQATRQSIRETTAQTAVNEWIDGTDYEPVNIVTRYPDFTVTIAGTGELKPVEELVQELDESLNGEHFVLVKIIQQDKDSHPEDN